MQILVFLDDDVIPGEDLLARYADVIPLAPVEDLGGVPAEQLGRLLQDQAPTLWSGVVADLPEIDDPERYDLDKLDKGAGFTVTGLRVKDGKIRAGVDITRLDSANLAMLAADFVGVGGFPNNPVVGEDSALAEVVRQLGGGLMWVGGATAYRQHVAAPEDEREDEPDPARVG